MAKKFNMSELAKEALGDVNVSKVDTVQQLDTALIDVNSANFYEMSDLEELASSIELVGLMHPVIVRPNGERYTLIDGERRFRAMTEVLGWTEIFAIVRRPANDVVEELMLIEANRTQRKMSAADLSKQAERYTELLVQLKEAGVAIPGRLRDRVAEALQVSSTKLARLHAIRENSVPRALALFDDGTLNESAAYSLQQLPTEHQELLAETVAIAGKGLSEYGVRDLDEYLQKFDKAKCKGGQACEHIQERLTMLNGEHSWNRHCPGCCKDCYRLDSCKTACPKLAEKVAKMKADAKAARADAKAAQEKEDARLKKIADDDWARLKALRERQGVDVDAVRDVRHGIIGYADYEGREKATYPAWTVRDYLRGYMEIEHLAALADILGVTMDEVLGRTPKGVSEMNHRPAGLEWHLFTDDDLPPDDGEVIFWGVKGLRRASAGSWVNYRKSWPDEYRWWAVIEGPEEEET